MVEADDPASGGPRWASVNAEPTRASATDAGDRMEVDATDAAAPDAALDHAAGYRPATPPRPTPTPTPPHPRPTPLLPPPWTSALLSVASRNMVIACTPCARAPPPCSPRAPPAADADAPAPAPDAARMGAAAWSSPKYMPTMSTTARRRRRRRRRLAGSPLLAATPAPAADDGVGLYSASSLKAGLECGRRGAAAAERPPRM